MINDIESSEYDLIILGPGPGHINDYPYAKDFVRENINNVKFLGICLGHQLLCDFIGFNCERLATPLHGASIEIPNVSKYLEIAPARAQFYNSWVMRGSAAIGFEYQAVYEKGFIAALFAKNIGGVQFHPESVGTNCPKLIFEKMLYSMYNRSYDLKNGRSLRLTNY